MNYVIVCENSVEYRNLFTLCVALRDRYLSVRSELGNFEMSCDDSEKEFLYYTEVHLSDRSVGGEIIELPRKFKYPVNKSCCLDSFITVGYDMSVLPAVDTEIWNWIVGYSYSTERYSIYSNKGNGYDEHLCKMLSVSQEDLRNKYMEELLVIIIGA